MLRNCKGIALLDALIGLSILLIFFSVALPSINELIRERNIIAERLYAITQLNNDLQECIYEKSNSVSLVENIEGYNNKQYKLTREINENKFYNCISWVASENREESICLYGYKAQ
jgi:hypothetical protein